VPDVVIGRPLQKHQGVNLADELSQPLARTIPLDQKDQP